MEHGLQRWRDRWTAAGVPTIPLWPNGKEPMCDSWNIVSPADQWAEVGGAAFRGNIALLTGHGLVGIDCDAPITVENVRAGIEGMGLRLPEQETQSKMTHFFARVRGVPDWFNWCNLAPEVGPGEFRAQNAYLVAQCSRIGENRYRFRYGGPEAIAALKPVRWQDLQWLIPEKQAYAGPLTSPPVPLVWRELPDKALALLQTSAMTTGPTKPFCGYHSRSEAEFAAVAMAILAGWSFDQVKLLFVEILPGHYRDAKDRERCISRMYTRALGLLASTPDRMRIAEAYRNAQLAPWPGRGGGLERGVYLALLAIAWQCDRWQVRAAVRTLAEHTAGGHSGAHKALRRLARADLVRRVEGWHWDHEQEQALATLWRVKMHNLDTENPVVERRGCVSGGSDLEQPVAGGEGVRSTGGENQSKEIVSTYCAFSNEVWARRRLGRSAHQVYCWLGADPLKIVELVPLTGKCRNTVARALDRLSRHDLAERVTGGWVRGAANLAGVAERFDAEEHARKRRAEHEWQRERWYEKTETRGQDDNGRK